MSLAKNLEVWTFVFDPKDKLQIIDIAKSDRFGFVGKGNILMLKDKDGRVDPAILEALKKDKEAFEKQFADALCSIA